MMSWDADDGLFGLDQECPVHGDESMVECRMCGAEYCRSCHPRSRICPTCTAEEQQDGIDDDLDDEDEPFDPDVAEVMDAEFGDFEDLDDGDHLPKSRSSRNA